MCTFNLISQNVDGDELYNVFSIKIIFPERAAIDNKIKHNLSGIKMIIQCSQQNV